MVKKARKTGGDATLDPRLLDRIRAVLESRSGVVEKRMFGGVCFMVDGRMCCGVTKDSFLVRVGKAAFAEAVQQPHARPMEMSGRVSNASVFVAPAGYRTEAALRQWLRRGLAFVDGE